MAGQPSLNLLLDCIICRRRRANNNPRVLACKHGFCLLCLLDTQSLNLEGQIQCPVCWQKTSLTQDGILGLPVDSKGLAAEKAFQITKKGQSCEPCSYKGIEKAACAYCMNCEFKLCGECATAHRTKEKLANHVIREEICKIHFRDFTHACMTCYSGLCLGCIVSEFHDDHDVCEVVDARDRASGLTTEKQVLLQEEIQSIDKMINSILDESTKKLYERRRETEEKLNVHKTKMLESIMAALDKRDQEFHKSANQSLEKQNQSSSQASNCLNEMRMDKEEKHGKLRILEMLSRTNTDMFSAINGIRISKTLTVKGPELVDDCVETIIDPDEGVFEFKIKLGRVHQQMTTGKPTKRMSVDRPATFDKKSSSLLDVSAIHADSAANYAVEKNVKGEEIRGHHSGNIHWSERAREIMKRDKQTFLKQLKAVKLLYILFEKGVVPKQIKNMLEKMKSNKLSEELFYFLEKLDERRYEKFLHVLQHYQPGLYYQLVQTSVPPESTRKGKY